MDRSPRYSESTKYLNRPITQTRMNETNTVSPPLALQSPVELQPVLLPVPSADVPMAQNFQNWSWPAHLTDAGNAWIFARLYGATMHYCHSSGKWLFWDGKRWQPDGEFVIMALAKEAVQLMSAAALQIKDFDQRKNLVKHALSSEGEKRLRSMISLARSEPGIAVNASQLDCDPFLLNCLNRTINLKTGMLRPHQREELLTKLAPVEYDPDAKRPMFNRFLNYKRRSNNRPQNAA